MPEPSLGARLGCVAALAVIGAGAAAFVQLHDRFRGSELFAAGASSPHDGATAAADPLAQQRALLDQEVAAVREEVVKLHDERMDAWKARLDLVADGYRKGKERGYDTLALRNRCSEPLDVAISYRALDDRWVTRGWWTVKPGERVDTDGMTRNAVVYFYAENDPKGWHLDGKGKPDSLDLEVVDSKFDHVHDERFVYPGARTVSFYARNTGEDWTDYVEDLVCAVEKAPLPAEKPDPRARAPVAAGPRGGATTGTP